MIDESGPKSIEQQAREAVGRRGIPGDVTNNHLGILMGLSEKEFWSKVTHIPTYEEYFRKIKLPNNPTLAEAVINASNQELVQKYNDVVRRINLEIGEGVTSEEQVARIREIQKEFRSIVYGWD